MFIMARGQAVGLIDEYVSRRDSGREGHAGNRVH